MSRPSKCPVCVGNASIAGEINNLIESGAKLTKIHAAYPELCSYSALSRHRNRCLASERTEALSTIDECRLWLSRADGTFASATALGDHRGASQAISTATRTLGRLIEMEEKEHEAKQAATVENDPNQKVTIQYLDQQVAEYIAQRDSENDHPRVKATALIDEVPAFTELLFAIWRDRSLISRLLDACTKENHATAIDCRN